MIAPRPEPDPSDAGRAPAAEEILDIEGASAYLGVSTKTFQKVLREGDVPGRKVGREWKFSRRALAEWVGRGKSRDFLDASDAGAEAPARGAGAAPPARRAAPGNGGAAAPGRRARPETAIEAEED